MKRLVSNKRGEVSYGPKLQNTVSSSDSENDDDDDHDDLHSHKITTAREDNEDQTPKGKKRVEVTVKDGELMYLAALRGDWLAAEVLLERDPNLAFDYVTEEGDRALHVAAAMRHEEFVEKLVERVSPKDLELVDGRGYTACCYAAVSGGVRIARLLLNKNPDLATLHGENDTTPLYKAASLGKTVLHFLESTKIEDLSTEEWFDLLLLTIRRQLFAAAEKIVEINESVATMSNEEGTALHLLVRQDKFYVFSGRWQVLLNMLVFHSDAYWREEKPPTFNKLAHRLWDLMQKMERASLLELIKEPNILHDAAKAGHAELIIMLTRTFPRLIWETDSNGYTVFHVAVAYRQYGVFNLIFQVMAVIDLSAMSQDQDGNNILHLAAKFVPRTRVRNPRSVILMQREMSWFMWTERLVPCCAETRNKEGLTPRELFSKEHKGLFEYSSMWYKNTADSFMLIATIFLTVVFALAFAVPGGYDGQTGLPILEKKDALQDVILLQAMALVSSVISIVMFRSIIASTCAEDDFLMKLPLRLYLGFSALFGSLMFATLGFLRSVMLVNPKTNAVMWIFVVVILLVLFSWIVIEFQALMVNRERPQPGNVPTGLPFSPVTTGRRKRNLNKPMKLRTLVSNINPPLDEHTHTTKTNLVIRQSSQTEYETTIYELG